MLVFKEINLSILIAASMVLNMIVAGLFGILVPVTLKKFNIDSVKSDFNISDMLDHPISSTNDLHIVCSI